MRGWEMSPAYELPDLCPSTAQQWLKTKAFFGTATNEDCFLSDGGTRLVGQPVCAYGAFLAQSSEGDCRSFSEDFCLEPLPVPTGPPMPSWPLLVGL